MEYSYMAKTLVTIVIPCLIIGAATGMLVKHCKHVPLTEDVWSLAIILLLNSAAWHYGYQSARVFSEKD